MRIRGTLLAVPLLLATTAVNASEYGSPEEARAMLMSTVEQMKANKDQTITQINEGQIMDRDLYPYCADADGQFTAHPVEQVRAMNLKELEDKEGKAFGEEIYEKAEEGEIAEVEYMWTRPGEDEPVQKVAYVTKVDDQVCGVGYYEEQ